MNTVYARRISAPISVRTEQRLRELAAREELPIAALVRRAIRRLLADAEASGVLPPIELIEERRRRFTGGVGGAEREETDP